MKNKVHVVIPYYLDRQALEKCIDCLEGSTFNNIKLYIRDNSIDNIYFTAAVNEGLKNGLLDVDVTHFLVINQDCYLKNNAIEILLSHFSRYSTCGIVCPIQINELNEVTWGGSLEAFPFGRHLKKPLDQYGDAFSTFWANGACMLIRRTLVEEIGLLDKNLRFICSDSDYSYSARSRGWEIHVAPPALAVHSLTSSKVATSEAVNLIKQQDLIYFYEKWISGELFRKLSHEGCDMDFLDISAWVDTLKNELFIAYGNK